VADLLRASSVIERLQLADERQAELAVELFEAALGLLESGGQAAQMRDVQLLGEALREIPIRFALERAYRDLAWTATGDEKVHLVECANEVRPLTAV
jgi:serine/threonine-protein kinase PknG